MKLIKLNDMTDNISPQSYEMSLKLTQLRIKMYSLWSKYKLYQQLVDDTIVERDKIAKEITEHMKVCQDNADQQLKAEYEYLIKHDL